jgi:hypothetical protein
MCVVSWCDMGVLTLSFLCRWPWLLCVKFICIYSTRFWNCGSCYENKFKLLRCRREFVPSIMTLHPRIKCILARKNCAMKNPWNQCMVRRYFYMLIDIGSNRWCCLNVVPYLVFMIVVAYLRKVGSTCNHFLMAVGVRVNCCPIKEFHVDFSSSRFTRSEIGTVDSVHCFQAINIFSYSVWIDQLLKEVG